MRLYFTWVVFGLLIGAMSPPCISANTISPAPQRAASRSREDNYCGLYSLYAAAAKQSVEMDFTSLLKQRYMSCSKGSTLDELALAAREHSLYASAIDRMTLSYLRSADRPIILHVKSHVAARAFDHYVTYLGYRDGRYEVLDPGEPIRRFTEAELLPRWSGMGLVISTEPIGVASIQAHFLWQFSAWSIAIGLALLVVRRTLCRLPVLSEGTPSGVIQAAVLLTGTCVIAFGFHSLSRTGLIAVGNTSGEVQDAFAATFLPKISTAKAKSLHQDPQTIFIDARLSADFNAGHISGAISIPISTKESDRAAAIDNIPASATVVVYCQSRGCEFADAIGAHLARAGHSNVRIFRDGWEGWQKP